MSGKSQAVNKESVNKPATSAQTFGQPKVVISAYLHAPVMLPGGQTEGSLTQHKLPGVRLFWARGEGLIVEYKNQKALIPAANVAIAYVDEAKEGSPV